MGFAESQIIEELHLAGHRTRICADDYSVPTSRAPIITFVFFFFFFFFVCWCVCVCASLTANGDLADRGLPAGVSKHAVVFVHSIIYINPFMACYLGLVTERLYHKQ